MLFNTIKNKLQDENVDQLLQLMGYKNKQTGQATLGRFLEEPNTFEWLNNGSFDFLHSSKSFLRALAKTLGVSKELVETEIEEAVKKIKAIASFQQPYIFIYTNFSRQSEPIHVLAVMEGKRNIIMGRVQFVFKTVDESLKIISNTVQEHYAVSRGVLELWGKIISYQYHHTDGMVYLFDVRGEIIKDVVIPESKATIHI